MDDDAGHEPGAAHVPITPELLADLQAGLLDDATAAELRQRVRTDTDAAEVLAALDRVRRDLADLGTDDASAPEVPAEVTARVGTALQAAPPHRPPREPAHSVRHTPRWQVVRLVAGVGAAVVGVVVGALMLMRDPAPTRSAGPTAESITVSRPATQLPLSDPQIVGLLSHSPDYGPLADPNSVRPVSPDWATRRPHRCWARNRSTCAGGPRCSCCWPPTRRGHCSRWSSSQTAIRLTPGCWPTRWSLVRNLSCRPRGTPGHTLVFVPVPT